MNLAQWIGDYSNPKSIGSRFRRARVQPLLDMIDAVFAEKGTVSILDVGGLESYWNIMEEGYLESRNAKILLLNLPDDVRPVTRSQIFTAQIGNGCKLEFPDNNFDICHSNSVIEHVGVWANKTAYAREVTRVASRYFHQTPNYWFPWEPHFGLPIFHWLPEPVRVWIAMHRALGWHQRCKTVAEAVQLMEYATLLNYKMFRFLFPDAEMRNERFLGIYKSFTAIRR